jgi:hypothetical protein
MAPKWGANSSKKASSVMRTIEKAMSPLMNETARPIMVMFGSSRVVNAKSKTFAATPPTVESHALRLR